MKRNKLFVLLAVLAVLCISFFFVYKNATRNVVTDLSVSAFPPKLNIDSVKKVVIDDGKEKVVLAEENGAWIIETKSGCLADSLKISSLFQSIAGIQYAEKKTANKEYHKELGLVFPPVEEKGGVILIFQSSKGEDIAALLFGRGSKTSTESGEKERGQYVRYYNEDQTYYIRDKINLDTKSQNWVDKKIINVKTEDIKDVTVSHAKAKNNINIARAEKISELALKNDVPKNKEIDSNVVKNIGSALQSFNFEDILPKDDAMSKELKFEDTYEAKLFSGAVYTVKIAKKDDKYYAVISAAADALDETTLNETMKAEYEKAKENTAGQNENFSKWLYVLPKSKGELLTKSLKDLRT